MTRVFSIIIPVYNVERFLKKCLDSVLKQTYQNYEILLIDDGSTDSSSMICDEYAAKYECCRVFHRKNAGVTASRNVGLSEAKGKYIVFLDSDDYIEKELLAKVYMQMEIQQYDICSFAARRIDEDGAILYELRYVDMITQLFFDDDSRDLFFWKNFLQYQTGWECCFHAFRKDIIEQNKIRFNENLRYAEDLLFTFEYLLYVKNWVKIPDVLYNYLCRRGSVTREVNKKAVIEGIMYHAFKDLSNSLCRKDSKRYDKQKRSIFYAALLQYFYPIFSCNAQIEDVREFFQNPPIDVVAKKQFKLLVTQKRALQKIYGKKEGAKLHSKVKFFLNGNKTQYEKRCVKISHIK